MSNADWYARKMGAPKPQQSMPATSPAPQVPYTPPPVRQNTQVQYNPDSDQLTTRASSAYSSERCPECNSGNYAKVGVQSTQNGSFAVMRCYDCGYPKIQAGSGVGSTGTPSGGGGKAIPARQPAMGSGFNPNIIVDRIG
jgi:predicted nucleic-acid-binding Zn-ribbon protein